MPASRCHSRCIGGSRGPTSEGDSEFEFAGRGGCRGGGGIWLCRRIDSFCPLKDEIGVSKTCFIDG